MKKMRLYGTCSALGALTVTGERSISGLLVAIKYLDTSFAEGADIVISTTSADGLNTNLLTITDGDASATYYPRHVVHSEAGAALTGTAGGDRTMPLLEGVPKMVVADGGNGGVGGVILYWLE